MEFARRGFPVRQEHLAWTLGTPGTVTRTEPRPMDCTEFLDRYSEYDDSLVAADDAERFRAHMTACEGCARYDRVLRKGRMLARQVPGPEPSRDFAPQLHMRLWSERTDAARPTSRIPVAVAAVPAVAIVVALAALLAPAPGPEGPAAPISLSAPTSLSDPASPQAPASSAPGVSIARGGGSGRTLALPVRLAAGVARPLGWTAPRVDPEASGSYSPLTMGPPAYGGANSRLGVSLTTYPSPD